MAACGGDRSGVCGARTMEARWEEFADWQLAYADMAEDAMRGRAIPSSNAINTMTWSAMEAWREEGLALWNWCARRRNRRASGTGQLSLEMWGGRAYVIDPLTGWWIEEPVPDQDADRVEVVARPLAQPDRACAYLASGGEELHRGGPG